MRNQIWQMSRKIREIPKILKSLMSFFRRVNECKGIFRRLPDPEPYCRSLAARMAQERDRLRSVGFGAIR